LPWSHMIVKCEIVTWDKVFSMCRILRDRIVRSGFQPETIIALARSGFIPGRLLSDFLSVPDLVSLKVEHWLDTTAEHKDVATIPYRTPFKIEGRAVLIADDIVDTGKSMLAAKEYLLDFKPFSLKTAVMQHIAPTAICTPDFYAELIQEWTWFVYPWNMVEDFRNLTGKLLSAKGVPLTLEELIAGFKEEFNVQVPEQQLVDALSEMERRRKLERIGDRFSLRPR